MRPRMLLMAIGALVLVLLVLLVVGVTRGSHLGGDSDPRNAPAVGRP